MLSKIKSTAKNTLLRVGRPLPPLVKRVGRMKHARLLLFTVTFGLIGAFFLYQSYAATVVDGVIINNQVIKLGNSIKPHEALFFTDSAPLYQYPKTGDTTVLIQTERDKIVSIIILAETPGVVPISMNVKVGEKSRDVRVRNVTARQTGRYLDGISSKGLNIEHRNSVTIAVEDECRNDGTISAAAVVVKDEKHIKRVLDTIKPRPELCDDGIDHE